MIAGLPDDQVKVTCACQGDDCGTRNGRGLVIERFPHQDQVLVAVADDDGDTDSWVTVSLSELLRALNGEER